MPNSHLNVNTDRCPHRASWRNGYATDCKSVLHRFESGTRLHFPVPVGFFKPGSFPLGLLGQSHTSRKTDRLAVKRLSGALQATDTRACTVFNLPKTPAMSGQDSHEADEPWFCFLGPDGARRQWRILAPMDSGRNLGGPCATVFGFRGICGDRSRETGGPGGFAVGTRGVWRRAC